MIRAAGVWLLTNVCEYIHQVLARAWQIGVDDLRREPVVHRFCNQLKIGVSQVEVVISGQVEQIDMQQQLRGHSVKPVHVPAAGLSQGAKCVSVAGDDARQLRNVADRRARIWRLDGVRGARV
jgi:hypothetical protein